MTQIDSHGHTAVGWYRLARQSVRRLVFEAGLHLQRAFKAGAGPRRVVIFPSNQPWDAASNLRAWQVAPALRRVGWRAVVVPEPLSLQQRLRVLRLERPDVILLQQTRHPLNRPHHYRPYPCVLDADDADYLDPRWHDMIATSATDAAAVVAGSRFVAQCLGRHNRNVSVIWTCTPVPNAPPRVAPDRRAPIVAWAHASPLRYPVEASFVQQIMRGVFSRTSCEFWLFGTDEQEAARWLEPLRALGGHCTCIPMLDYDAYLGRVGEAAVGLQPVCIDNEFSRGKSFGKLLAYLAGKVAVVASDEVDHPLFFRSGENGFLAGTNPSEWADRIVALLEDTNLRAQVAECAWRDFRRRLVTDEFAARLSRVLDEASKLRT